MLKTITFTKMHGIGNDYVYINCLNQEIENPNKLAVILSNRHFSVGGDGVILILKSEIADFRMRMFNADGLEGNMCGNGVRCIGKFVYDKKLTDKKTITLETKAGIKILDFDIKAEKVASVKVDMGQPALAAHQIPVETESTEVINQVLLPEILNLPCTCVSMGVPHTAFFVDKITDKLVLEVGPKIEKHQIFPERTNVEFVEVINRKELKMRVWERGSGETLACGTGACAAAVAAIKNGFTERNVTVHMLGGDLEITWERNNQVFMKGVAEIAFEGTVEVDL